MKASSSLLDHSKVAASIILPLSNKQILLDLNKKYTV